mgnify:CR=1 FL=1
MSFPKALIRWIIVVAVGWLFMFLTPGQWFVNWYIPMSFFLLMGTVTFGVIGLGWPFAAPGGSWKPGTNRWVTGILMTIVWIVFALIMTAIETWIWPGNPLSGAASPEGVPGNYGAWAGIGVFTATLWYAFIGIEPRPYGPAKSWANWLLSSCVILVVAALMFILCVHYDPTVEGMAKASWLPHGVWFGGDWMALCVWIIVFIQMFGMPMVFQGWPWYKLGQPAYPIVNTVWVIALGYVFWRWVMPGLFPDSTTFTWGAIGASVIGWSLMSSIAFEFWPFARLKQPARGVAMFILWQLIVPALWIMLIRWVIGPPILTHLNDAFGGPAMDINLVTAFFTLHVTAIVLLIHNFFYMRVPLSIPGPPLGPEEIPPAPAK